MQRFAAIVICTSYTAAFVVVYKNIVVPVWGYEGFRSSATPARAAAGWFLAVLPSAWMPLELKRPSVLVYWLLYLLVIVPACIVPVNSLLDKSNGPIELALCIVMVFAATRVIYSLPLLPIPRVRLQSYQFIVLLLLASCIAYAAMISTFGFHLRYVPLSQVYSTRTAFKETLVTSSRVVPYLIAWQMYVINPLAIGLGVVTRRRSLIALGTVGELAIYSISGFRDVLFATAFLLYLAWAMRKARTFGLRFACTWTAIFSFAAALEWLRMDRTLPALVLERMTGLPGLLTGFYYEFFSSHPKALLGQSFLFDAWVQYPYDLATPQVIGYVYFHSRNTFANANLWADAYANFGFPGIIIFTLLFAIVLWMYDSLAVGRNDRLMALVVALPAFALANSGLLTCLVTHGIGVAMILVYLMPTDYGSRRRQLS